MMHVLSCDANSHSREPITSLEMSLDESLIIASNEQGSAHVFDDQGIPLKKETGTLLRLVTSDGTIGNRCFVQISPDNLCIAIGLSNGDIKTYQI